MDDSSRLTAAIRLAHAKEVHPSDGDRVPWKEADLTALAAAYLPVVDGWMPDKPLNVVLRVSYLTADGRDIDPKADFALATGYAPDITPAQATAISRYTGVAAVSIYTVNGHGELSDVPVVILADGDRIA